MPSPASSRAPYPAPIVQLADASDRLLAPHSSPGWTEDLVGDNGAG